MATYFSDSRVPAVEALPSAVSWESIFAGAIVTIATTLILIALGTRLGFAAASPWPGGGPAITTFAIGVGIWLIATQWLSSALAGYVTGRLRTKWTGIHADEVLFRDTAHGLLAWAVATTIVDAVAFAVTTRRLGRPRARRPLSSTTRQIRCFARTIRPATHRPSPFAPRSLGS